MSYLLLAVFLLLNLLVGLWQIGRAPSQAERLLVAQLFTTLTVAMLLVLVPALGIPALVDVALLFALLAALVAVAYVRLPNPGASTARRRP